MPKPSWFRSLGPVQKAALFLAAVGLGLLAMNLYYENLAPSPYDLRVLGQVEMLPGAEASLRVIVYDHQAAAGVAGVPVRIELRRGEAEPAVAEFRTDVHGTGQPRLQLPDWEEGDCELGVTAWPGGQVERVTRTVRLRPSGQVLLGTDKPAYQPGQVIHLRGLLLRAPDLRPQAGRPTEFTITDPKSNRIFRRRETTSRFGIAAADCPLAGEIIEGRYEVQCRADGRTSTSAVEVKRYTLPKMRLGVALDRPYFQPGEVLRGTVQADYTFGQPVVGGQVTIDVRTADRPERDLGQQTATTDTRGQATFEVRLPEDLLGREGADRRLALRVTVADPAGQQQERRVECLATSGSLRVEVVPEAGHLVRGLPNRLYVLTRTADGRPAPARVRIPDVSKEEITTGELGTAVLEWTPSCANLE
jgi:hypothetical protein